MRDDYESLLSHLATPVDSVQPESTENCNMSVINTIRNESSTVLQTLCPPVAQPCDEEVPNNLNINENEISSSSKRNRKCANYPVCSSLAKDCGGWKRAHCSFYKNGDLNMPDDETFHRLKRKQKNESNRTNMRNKRNNK